MAATQNPQSAPLNGNRWTDEEVETLFSIVKKSPTAQAAFKVVGKKLGKNPGTVQQKYYHELRKRNPSKPKASNPGTPVKRKAAQPVKQAPTATKLDELVANFERCVREYAAFAEESAKRADVAEAKLDELRKALA